MNESEARRFFSTYLDWIRSVWQTGWNDYYALLMHPDDDSRTRSTNIQNRAIIYAKKTCEQHGVKFFTFNSRRLFRIGSQAIIQFKKLSEELLPINNMNLNDAAEAFDRQGALSGLDDTPRITAGYLPNEAHTGYDLFLVLPKSHYAFNWFIPISSDQQIIQLTYEPLDLPTEPTRVRIKGSKPAAASDDAAASS